MADCVLHFGGQFTESLLQSFRNENRVVAKSGVASCFIGDYFLRQFLRRFRGDCRCARAPRRSEIEHDAHPLWRELAQAREVICRFCPSPSRSRQHNAPNKFPVHRRERQPPDPESSAITRAGNCLDAARALSFAFSSNDVPLSRISETSGCAPRSRTLNSGPRICWISRVLCLLRVATTSSITDSIEMWKPENKSKF